MEPLSLVIFAQLYAYKFLLQFYTCTIRFLLVLEKVVTFLRGYS